MFSEFRGPGSRGVVPWSLWGCASVASPFSGCRHLASEGRRFALQAAILPADRGKGGPSAGWSRLPLRPSLVAFSSRAALPAEGCPTAQEWL